MYKWREWTVEWCTIMLNSKRKRATKAISLKFRAIFHDIEINHVIWCHRDTPMIYYRVTAVPTLSVGGEDVFKSSGDNAINTAEGGYLIWQALAFKEHNYFQN